MISSTQSATRERLRILMLVGQDPFLDPRIHWAAGILAVDHDVTVLGLSGGKTPREDLPYKVITVKRLTSTPVAAEMCIRYFKEVFFQSKRKVAWLKFFAKTLYPILFGIPLIPLAGVGVVVRSIAGSGHAYNNWLRPKLVRQFQVPAVIRHFIWSSSAFLDAIEKMDLKFDVVHCNDMDTLFPGRILSLRTGCLITYDAHEFWPKQNPDMSAAESSLYENLEYCLLEDVQQAWTVSPGIANLFARTYGKLRMDVVPNAEPTQTHSNITPFDKDFPEGLSGKTRFLYLGGFAPGRGIDTIIRFWARLKRSDVVLILRGPDNRYKTQLIELASTLGVLNRSVFFLAPVTESELVAAAKAVHVGIIPYEPSSDNNRYCCPNKLSQYMQAGLPILATDLDFLRATISKADCGLVYAPGDFKAFEVGVETLVQNPEMRAKMSESAKRFAAEEFNWEKVSVPMVNYYRTLASARTSL